MPCRNSFKIGIAECVAWITQIRNLEDNLSAFPEICGCLICEPS